MFALGRVVIIPPGVGVARPRLQVGAAVSGGRCSYPLRTTDPTGVIRFRPGRGLTLGDVFAVWGQPLSRHRLCGFASADGVRVYVGGRRFTGAPAAVPLRRHEEIVVEIGRICPAACLVCVRARKGGDGMRRALLVMAAIACMAAGCNSSGGAGR